jgi:hypothetical protein
MIEIIKEKIAGFVVKNKLKHSAYESRIFTNFFKKSFSFFVIMPENETDFHQSIQVLEGLELHRKNPTIFTYDFRMNLIPVKYRHAAVGHTREDFNKLKLPVKKLSEKLSHLEFQAVLDLNREDNVFYGYCANLVKAPIRASFVKESSDNFYNFQILNRQDNAEISYKNFLNCLEMF